MNKLSIGLGVIIIILLAAIIPFAVIWALNVLFVLGIPYTFTTWVASFVFISVFSTGRLISYKNN
jgi:hypothetical protein